MTTTTIPVGDTGQVLEGLLVNGAVRESVVQADPTDPEAFAAVTSTTPAAEACYFGSSQAYVMLCNNSTAVAPASATRKMILGLQSSTTIAHSFPVGSEYSQGILMYTVRTPFAAGSGTTGILGSSMTVSICYE